MVLNSKCFLAYVVLTPLLLSGQGIVSPTSSPATVTDSVPVNWQAAFSRWVHVDTFSFSARYRGIRDSEEVHTYTQGQQRSLFEGSLKLDKKAKYAVHFRLSSGHYFDWAYADLRAAERKKQTSFPFPIYLGVTV